MWCFFCQQNTLGPSTFLSCTLQLNWPQKVFILSQQNSWLEQHTQRHDHRSYPWILSGLTLQTASHKCQPGSVWSSEHQPHSDRSKWPHVTIMWLSWTSILFSCSCVSLFFVDLTLTFFFNKNCLKPKTVIAYTNNVHKVEREYDLMEEQFSGPIRAWLTFSG